MVAVPAPLEEIQNGLVGARLIFEVLDAPQGEPPQPGCMAPGSDNKVMHACFKIGDTSVMASDGRCEGKPSFQGFSLSLTVKDEAEAVRVGALHRPSNLVRPVDDARQSSSL